MSQKAFLRELDADLHEAMADAGMADEGMYTPPNAAPDFIPIPVRCYVDRGLLVQSTSGHTATRRTEIGLLKEDVSPRREAIVVVDGDTFKLESPVELSANITRQAADDGSIAWWTASVQSGVAP